jgi:3-hydroxybenzoate 6-monooxygenase
MHLFNIIRPMLMDTLKSQDRVTVTAVMNGLISLSLHKGRTQARFYDAIEWLYGGHVNNCLAQD